MVDMLCHLISGEDGCVGCNLGRLLGWGLVDLGLGGLALDDLALAGAGTHDCWYISRLLSVPVAATERQRPGLLGGGAAAEGGGGDEGLDVEVV